MIILWLLVAILAGAGTAFLVRRALAITPKIQSQLWSSAYLCLVCFVLFLGFTLAMMFIPAREIVWASYFGSSLIFAINWSRYRQQ